MDGLFGGTGGGTRPPDNFRAAGGFVAAVVEEFF